MNTPPPFRDVLELGSKGTQPVAVKRALYRANFKKGWEDLGCDAIAAEILGAAAVENLRVFQRYHGLPADGIYNKTDHEVLDGSFDAYAEMLYRKSAEPPVGTLILPATFPPTHQTGGLSGYPAIDNRDWLKSSAIFRRLPELKKAVTALQRRLDDLEQRLKP